jgi:hypothetical protein
MQTEQQQNGNELDQQQLVPDDRESRFCWAERHFDAHDFFSKHHAFFPFCYDEHWTTEVVCNPSLLVEILLGKDESCSSSQQPFPCILHFNSQSNERSKPKDTILELLVGLWVSRQVVAAAHKIMSSSDAPTPRDLAQIAEKVARMVDRANEHMQDTFNEEMVGGCLQTAMETISQSGGPSGSTIFTKIAACAAVVCAAAICAAQSTVTACENDSLLAGKAKRHASKSFRDVQSGKSNSKKSLDTVQTISAVLKYLLDQSFTSKEQLLAEQVQNVRKALYAAENSNNFANLCSRALAATRKEAWNIAKFSHAEFICVPLQNNACQVNGWSCGFQNVEMLHIWLTLISQHTNLSTRDSLMQCFENDWFTRKNADQSAPVLAALAHNDMLSYIEQQNTLDRPQLSDNQNERDRHIRNFLTAFMTGQKVLSFSHEQVVDILDFWFK